VIPEAKGMGNRTDAMNVPIAIVTCWLIGVTVLSGPDARGAQSGEVAQQAAAILKSAGVRGGLVVHLYCGNGQLTAALRADEGFLVQGLEADPGRIAQAREHIRRLGLHGGVRK